MSVTLRDISGDGSEAAQRRYALVNQAWHDLLDLDKRRQVTPHGAREVPDLAALRSRVEALGNVWDTKRIGSNSPWADRTGYVQHSARRYRPADVRAVLARIDRLAASQ